MIYNNITYNGKNSYADLGVIITDKDMGAVELKRVTVTIPYTNKPLTFDYSNIAGKPTYNERKLSYTFAMLEDSEANLFAKYYSLRNWLLQSNTGELSDSDLPDYYYTARCINVSKLTRVSKGVGKITAEFSADPFMYSRDKLDYKWDDIVFTADTLNAVCYPSAKSLISTYLIYNPTDRYIQPQVTITGCEANNCCELNNVQHIFYGDCKDTKVDNWTLKPGQNVMTMVGTGTMTMAAVEEVL